MGTSNDNGMRDGHYGSPHQAAVSEVAHLFRTPLGVITGYAGLLQLRDDPERRAESLQQIEAAAARLGGVIDLLVSVLESESEGLSELLVERWQEQQEAAAHRKRMPSDAPP
jgi:signal transduction histidine kinase